MQSTAVEPPSQESSSSATTVSLKQRLELTRGQLTVLTFHALIFCGLTWLPVPAIPVWGYISRGSELWSRREFPVTETLVPLARGMPFVQTSWGTDLAVFAASLGGFATLKLLFAAVVVVGAWGVYRLSGSQKSHEITAVFAPACLVSLVVFSSGIYDGVCLGMLCLLAVEWLMARRNRLRLVLVPAVFAVWANLHPSFLIGFLWLSATLLSERFAASETEGMVCETQTHRTPIWESALLLELAVVATLVNPYGPWLCPAAWNQLLNSRLEEIGGAGAISIRTLSGMLGAALYLLTIVCTLRKGDAAQRRRLLPMTVMGLVAAGSVQFVPLWAVSLSMAFAQAMSLLSSRNNAEPADATSRLHQSRTSNKINLAIAAVLIWIGFSFSSVGAAWLSPKKPVAPHSQLAGDVPYGAAEYLREHPPRTLIFNPAPWGDYLLLFGPRDLQVFTTSAVDRLPAAVWAEYKAIAVGLGSADGLLDRYGIDVVVFDLRKSAALAEELRAARVWEPVYRDDRSAIFERRTPAP